MGGATVGLSLDQTKYVTVNERPVYLDFTKPDHKKPSSGNIRVGVSMMKWSCDGRYIASKCENLPTTVWIWDIAQVIDGNVILGNVNGKVECFIQHTCN